MLRSEESSMRYAVILIATLTWVACDPDDPCPGATLCDGVCVDADVDPSNCGSCGNVCDEDLVCQDGGCNLTCVGGTTDCSGSCLNLSNDGDNCGACGNACADGLVCVESQCTLICVGGTTNCDGSCFNLQASALNCGACGTTCAPGEICTEGQCGVQCYNQDTECANMCVDVTIDPLHCGACDSPCAEEEVCSESACGLNCVGGTSNCGGVCVNTSSDADNCGACGVECTPTQACVNSVCSDPQPFILPVIDQGWHATFNDGHVADDENLTLMAEFAFNDAYAPGFVVIDTSNMPAIVTSASLRLLMTNWGEWNDEWEAMEAWDVTTPIATLTASGSSEAIVNDLSGGVIYGGQLLYAGLQGPSPFEFNLNGAALDALRNAGDTIAIGLNWASPSDGALEGASFSAHAGRNSLLVMGFNP